MTHAPNVSPQACQRMRHAAGYPSTREVLYLSPLLTDLARLTYRRVTRPETRSPIPENPIPNTRYPKTRYPIPDIRKPDPRSPKTRYPRRVHARMYGGGDGCRSSECQGAQNELA